MDVIEIWLVSFCDFLFFCLSWSWLGCTWLLFLILYYLSDGLAAEVRSTVGVGFVEIYV
jgi:hypothetical protein